MLAPYGDGAAHSGTRYVVSMRVAGLGDRIVCLGAAWLYARNTGRTLVIDWRHGYISPKSKTNGFPLCFKNSGQLAGVPIVCDDRVNELQLPLPRYPAIWNDETLLRDPMRRPPELEQIYKRAAVSLMLANRDRPEPAMIFDGCVHDGLVRFADAHQVFQALEPVDCVTEAVEDFRRRRFGEGPIIGLHIRHGNGGDIMAHARFWTSFEEAMKRCLRCVEIAREKLGHAARVFLCTDSSEVEEAAHAMLRGVFTRPKQFRPVGEGELHHVPNAWEGRDDALVEMVLLSHTQALIRYPPGSFFTAYAAVMKARAEPPRPALIMYDLLAGVDERDPLSAALII